MANNKPIASYFILYLPWLLAILLQSESTVSYLVAWLGSFFIFQVCYSGRLKPMPADLPIAEQIMRPVFLVQLIFIGYMACSSIFYFLNVLGDVGAVKNHLLTPGNDKLAIVAKCQRYYVLGHAAFVTGLLSRMDYSVKVNYTYDKVKLANTLLFIAIVCLPVSVLSLQIPGLSQFYVQLSALSFISGTLALAFAIPLQKLVNIGIAGVLYVSNFYQALTSGFKEPIIVSVLVLGLFLYPIYKKFAVAVFVPVMLLLFLYLPTYNKVYRANAWADNANSNDAYSTAIDATLNSDNDLSNWEFLVFRISEIDMFTTFVQSTPDKVDYYGFDLVQQALISILPRFFWPDKPSTESLVMERVYKAGVVYRGSSVSAKPAYIVDGFLSGGSIGVFLALFIYGAAVQLISQKAEQLFGGYLLGTALIFTGLFQIFWRGLSFEFILNSVFWSYITMLIIHKIFVATNFLKRV